MGGSISGLTVTSFSFRYFGVYISSFVFLLLGIIGLVFGTLRFMGMAASPLMVKSYTPMFLFFLPKYGNGGAFSIPWKTTQGHIMGQKKW